jgi:hypothetical protein
MCMTYPFQMKILSGKNEGNRVYGVQSLTWTVLDKPKTRGSLEPVIGHLVFNLTSQNL